METISLSLEMRRSCSGLANELKIDVLGPDTHQEKEVRVLNRIIRWTRHGLECEPDQRHEEKIVCDLGMEKASEVLTPCVQGATNPNADDGQKGLLQPLDATKFRSIAARINYLAADIPDLQFASKCASKYMANPTCEGLTVLKRIGRYLKAHQRMVQRFDWCAWQSELQGYADSDWAGDTSSYKSTSGGTLMWGSHTLKTWATSQSTIALRSSEAELFAMTKVAVQMKGMMSLAADFEISLKGIVRSDSAAAIWIAHRKGIGGRCRHINVQYLWIQESVQEGHLESSRHDDEDSWLRNMQQHLKFMNFRNAEHLGRGGVQEFTPLCWTKVTALHARAYREVPNSMAMARMQRG